MMGSNYGFVQMAEDALPLPQQLRPPTPAAHETRDIRHQHTTDRQKDTPDYISQHNHPYPSFIRITSNPQKKRSSQISNFEISTCHMTRRPGFPLNPGRHLIHGHRR